jgi:hypothetical protein
MVFLIVGWFAALEIILFPWQLYYPNSKIIKITEEGGLHHANRKNQVVQS